MLDELQLWRTNETYTETHYSQSVKSQRENLKSNKRKVTCHIQGRILVDFSAETMQAIKQ